MTYTYEIKFNYQEQSTLRERKILWHTKEALKTPNNQKQNEKLIKSLEKLVRRSTHLKRVEIVNVILIEVNLGW